MARIRFPTLRRPAWLDNLHLPAWLRASSLPRPVFIGLIAFGSTLAAVLLVFGIDRATNGGEVLGSVVVNGVDVGGLSERDAIARLQDLETALRDTPVPVTVAGENFSLDPRVISFDLDEQAAVAAAMRNGRSGNIFGQLGWWLTHWGADPVAVEPGYSFDQTRLEEILSEWEVEGIARPAYPGDVRVEDGAIVFEYPAAGTGIERDAAFSLLDGTLLDPGRSTVTLPTRLIEPALTQEDIDAAVADAGALVGGDITLVNEDIGTQVVLPRDLLTRSLVITRDDAAPTPRFTMAFDEAALMDYVAGFAPYLETDPTDAEIVIDDEAETVTIVPSVPAMQPDPALLLDEIMAAIETPDRTGSLAYAQGREADFSTEDAEALGIRDLIGEFTTYHPCCQARVTNIQTIARAVDGALVMPGETFSLNDHVGQRTVEKGYVCAGALLGNELVEEGPICIGGGTSQFTTTIYNATFFAGLEDIAHTPHSIWFSRYPEGREATIGWRSPEFIFRNNTENALIIKTSYTDTSITVKIYGDNGGLQVEAGLSNRYGHTGIVKIFRQNNELAAPYCGVSQGDTSTWKKVQSGSPGWSVTVYRYITYPDGTKTTESWPVRYQGAWEIWEADSDDPTCVGPPPPPDP